MEINVKDIILKRIDSTSANKFIKQWHYSGKVVANSQLHFGCFVGDRLMGVLSYGPSTDKRKIIGLVSDTKWNEFIELNRMAFHEDLPKNSESRCIAISIKLIKKNCPQIKWIISFADGCQCGDGTIYRASGFYLTNVKENNRLIRFNDGYITHGINLCHRGSPVISQKYNPYNLTENKLYKLGAFQYVKGFQIRYIYFIDKTKIKDLVVPILPFSTIQEMGASMYKGEKIVRQ